MNSVDEPISDAAAFARHPHRWLMLAGVWSLYSCFGLTIATMAPLVRPITEDLGISHTQLGTIMGAWPLVYIFMAIPCGIFLDKFGPRRALFLAGLVIALSCGLRGFASSYLTMFAAVALFGVGGPLLSVGAPKVVSLWFEGKERGFAMGAYMTGPAVGSMIALSLTNSVLMPAFDDNWRVVFFMFGALALLLSFTWVAINMGSASKDMERWIASEPSPPQLEVFAGLLQVPAVLVMLLMCLGMFFYFQGLNNWLPEILRSAGMSAAAAGYWATLPIVVGIIGSLTIPHFAVPHRRLPILLGLFLSVSIATLLLQMPQGVTLTTALILMGLARGSMITVALLVLVELPQVSARYAGAAGGLFFTVGEVGGVLGPITIGSLYDLSGGFSSGLYLLSLITLVLALLTLPLWRATRVPALAGAE